MLRASFPEENRVIVRYWPGPLSSFSLNSTGSYVSFGHVSLQTFVGGPGNRGYYISFWRADMDHRCCGKQEDHIHDREEDVRYCGQAHVDNTFTLYSLDPGAINAAYESIMRRGLRWELSASLVHRQDERAATCSSLIYRLLVAGRIERLLRSNERLFLGLFDTMKVGLISGISSSFYLVPKFIDLIQHLKYVSVTFGCAKNICKSEKWGYIAYMPILRDCEKYIHDTPSHGHSYWFYYHENPFIFFKSLNSIREKYGWMTSCSILTLVILTAFLATFIGQRAATNYLIVKPADFPLLMKRAIAAEQRLPRPGITFFDRRNTSAQNAPAQAFEPRDAPRTSLTGRAIS